MRTVRKSVKQTENIRPWLYRVPGGTIPRFWNTGAGAGRKRHGGTEAEAVPEAFAGAFIVPRAEILAHEGRGRHGQGLARQHDEAVDLVGCADPCRDARREAVDVGPDKNVGERDQRVLQAGRKADAD